MPEYADIPDLFDGSRPHWTTISVRFEGELRSLTGHRWLAELFRWLRGESLRDLVFLDPQQGRKLRDPRQVDWNQFPLDEAIEAAQALAIRSTGRPRRVGQ